jgi:hypothetical protein
VKNGSWEPEARNGVEEAQRVKKEARSQEEEEPFQEMKEKRGDIGQQGE